MGAYAIFLMAPRRNVDCPCLAPFEYRLTIFPAHRKEYIPAHSFAVMLAVSVPCVHIGCRLRPDYRNYKVVLRIEGIIGDRIGEKHLQLGPWAR